MNRFKKIAAYTSIIGGLGLSGFAVNAHMHGGEGLKNCPHMGQSGEKGNCPMKMKDCPMMDEKDRSESEHNGE